jgi:hypothetical protein
LGGLQPRLPGADAHGMRAHLLSGAMLVVEAVVVVVCLAAFAAERTATSWLSLG